MNPREIFKDQQVFEDGTRLEAVVYDVPDDPQFPEDVKVRFQFYDPDLDREDKTILRYDNTHVREGHKFHKHDVREGDEEIEPIEFQGDVMALYDTFLQEVKTYREQRQ